MQLYQFIASELVRMDTTFRESADDNLRYVEKNFLPSGSGIDNGCKITQAKMNGLQLESFSIKFGYHHMNDAGYYTHWTEHRVTITPDWEGFRIRISGPDKDGLKEYLYDTFQLALSLERSRKEFQCPAKVS